MAFIGPTEHGNRRAIGVRSEYAAKRVRYLNGAAIEAQRHVQDCIGRSGPYMNEID
ncbi:MAG: hypothetical protein JOZ60_06525 [Verrucomicrobia bacterium]|nr:hypothetical protein [Verrucomicrobiota bacterium]